MRKRNDRALAICKGESRLDHCLFDNPASPSDKPSLVECGETHPRVVRLPLDDLGIEALTRGPSNSILFFLPSHVIKGSESTEVRIGCYRPSQRLSRGIPDLWALKGVVGAFIRGKRTIEWDRRV